MKHQICRNCGQRVAGNYCANCGQKNNVGRLRWGAIFDGFTSTFLGDGAISFETRNARYGIIYTLWALVLHPGRVVSEYLEGCRRKYFNPITLLVLLSTFYALLNACIGNEKSPELAIDEGPVHYIRTMIEYSVNHPIMWYLPQLPFIALVFKWFFRKRVDFLYVEYLYIGVFSSLFALMLLIVRIPLESFAPNLAGITALLSFAAYAVFSVALYRSLFLIGRMRALWNWVAVMLLGNLSFYVVICLLLTLVFSLFAFVSPEHFEQTIDILGNQKAIQTDAALHDALQGIRDALQEGADSLRTE